jgi:methionine aminotransferase
MKSKLPNTKTSIFAVMSQMANKYNAINLSQGFPDFNVSPKLIDLVNKNMKLGYNQYAPMPGVMKLREIISEKTQKLYGKYYNPETEITITSGATQALYTAITAIVNEGDEVIVFEPVYDSYVPAIELSGGKTVFLELKGENYKIDWKEVQKVITSKTRMIIINSPHNPTGATLDSNDIKQLEKIVAGTNIILLSDEVYEHIIFDGKKHLSFSGSKELSKRSIIVSSFGKTFHTTGWKTGYCVAPEEIMKEFRKVHQFVVYCVNTPLQYAIAEYLEDESTYLELSNMYQERRDYFLNAIKGSKFELIPTSGTYFQLLDYSKISEEKDTIFAELLTKEHKIASIPVSAFYHDKIKSKVLRFCFAKGNDTLDKAAEQLLKL